MTKPPFDVIVRQYGPTVYRVCRALVGHDDAEDAWSETFLAALRSYPALEGVANIEAWLVRIAHNKAVDLVRMGAKQRALSARVVEIPGDARDPTSALALGAALTQLPTRQRQAVAYHYLADLPYSQVADIMGGTPAAARRAASDGMATLRTRLGKEL